MKNPVNVLVAVLFLIGLLSCSKAKDEINKSVKFDINYSTLQTIPSASVSVSGPAEFVTPNVATNSASTFKSYNTSTDLVEEVKMTKFAITNQSGNLNFLKSISVYLKATGLSDVLVATKENIPEGLTTVSCDMTSTNIKEHIFKDSIQFRISVNIKNSPTADQVLKLDQTVSVSGKIF